MTGRGNKWRTQNDIKNDIKRRKRKRSRRSVPVRQPTATTFLPSFTGFFFPWSCSTAVVPSFTGFPGVRFRLRGWQRRLLGFTGFGRGPTERRLVLPGFYLVLPISLLSNGVTGFYRVFRVMYKSSPSIYWVLLCFTEFYWVLLCFTGF